MGYALSELFQFKSSQFTRLLQGLLNSNSPSSLSDGNHELLQGEIHEEENKSSDNRTAQGDHTDHERGILTTDYKGNCELF